MKRALLFDTETTSLVANHQLPLQHQPRIIEFYGCVIDEEGELLDEYEFICHPGIDITEEITKITGIKPEDVKAKPGISAYAEGLKRIIESADALVAHNLSYDFFVLTAEFERLKMDVRFPITRVCTVEETIHLKGHRLSLSNLHEHLFGEAFSGAHRARVDVQAMVRCFNEMRKRGMI
jgi:DNA polymerase-3 subunit alpha